MSLRFVTAGESHGPGLTAIVEGLPAGLELSPEDIDRDLARRQLGHGRGGRMKIEKDRADVVAGVRHGRTLGSPVALRVDNRDYRQLGGADEPVAGGRPRSTRCTCRARATPTWPACSKYGHTDVRNVLERASARETAARVAAGALAKALLRDARRRRCCSHVTRIGTRHRARARRPAPGGLRGRRRVAGALPRRRRRATAMVAEIDAARKANESLGGVFEVRAFGLVPGHRLAHLLGGAPRRPAGRRDHVDPGDEGRGHRRRLRPRRAGRLAGARRDLLVGGAGLLPRDQPRRRPRGRHDHRRPGRGAGRDEAAADADQAAAQRRPRHQGAGRRRCASAPTPARCPPRAWWARRWSRSCWRAAYREKLGGDHIDDARAALAPTRSASGGGAASVDGAIVLVGLHGRREVDRRPRARRGAGRGRRSTPTASSSARSASRSSRSSTARARRPSARARRRWSASCSTATDAAGDRARRRGRPVRARARGARPPHGRAPGDRARRTPGGGRRARAGRWRATRAASSSSTRDRRRALRGGGDAVVPPADRDALRRALPVRCAPSARPRRAPGWCGRRPSRATTRSSSAAA